MTLRNLAGHFGATLLQPETHVTGNTSSNADVIHEYYGFPTLDSTTTPRNIRGTADEIATATPLESDQSWRDFLGLPAFSATPGWVIYNGWSDYYIVDPAHNPGQGMVSPDAKLATRFPTQADAIAYANTNSGVVFTRTQAPRVIDGYPHCELCDWRSSKYGVTTCASCQQPIPTTRPWCYVVEVDEYDNEIGPVQYL